MGVRGLGCLFWAGRACISRNMGTGGFLQGPVSAAPPEGGEGTADKEAWCGRDMRVLCDFLPSEYEEGEGKKGEQEEGRRAKRGE